MTDFSFMHRNQGIMWSIIAFFVLALVAIGYTTVGANKAMIATTTTAGSATFGMPPGFGTNPTTTVKALTEEEKALCGITARTSEGPYYISDTKALTKGDLNYTHLPGTPVRISGYVYEGVGTSSTPIPQSVIEIWEADQDGNYRPASNGKGSDYKTDELALRGYVVTDVDGHYVFTALYPGKSDDRARHVNIKVLAPDRPPLTTELFFPAKAGDDVTFNEDRVSQGLPNCHLLTINSSTTPASALFDFHLSK